MNQYFGIGNLVKDPYTTITEKQTYCNFTIAVNNRNDDSTFIDIVCYGRQAEAAEKHLIKGSQVCIKGVPTVKAYLDKEGNPRAVLKVRVREIDFLNKLKPKALETGNLYRRENNV